MDRIEHPTVLGKITVVLFDVSRSATPSNSPRLCGTRPSPLGVVS